MALGSTTVGGFTSAVTDLFAGFGDEAKATADLAEQQEYELAGNLAGQNAQFTQMSTGIKEAQQNREVTQALGKTRATVAGAGFAASGTALDIMRSGAQQGSIALSALNEQGLITTAGYEEQQQSYETMANAAGQAAQAEKTAATGAFISGGINAVLGFASLATGGVTSGASLLGPGNGAGDSGMGGWTPAAPGL